MMSPPESIYRGWQPEIDEFIRRIRVAYTLCPMGATSWWRDYMTNKNVGGNEYSQHLIATAADVYPLPPRTKDDLVRALRAAGLVAVTGYPTHVHTQLFQAGYLAAYAFD